MNAQPFVEMVHVKNLKIASRVRRIVESVNAEIQSVMQMKLVRIAQKTVVCVPKHVEMVHVGLMKPVTVVQQTAVIVLIVEMEPAIQERAVYHARVIAVNVQRFVVMVTAAILKTAKIVKTIAESARTLVEIWCAAEMKPAVRAREIAVFVRVVAMATAVVMKPVQIAMQIVEHALMCVETEFVVLLKIVQDAVMIVAIALAIVETVYVHLLKIVFLARKTVENVNSVAMELVIPAKIAQTAIRTADFVLTYVVITYAVKLKIVATALQIVALALLFAVMEDVKLLKIV